MTNDIERVSGFDDEIIDGITIYTYNKLEPRKMIGDRIYKNFQVWKPYLIAFAKENKLKTIFISDDTVYAPDMRDTLFINTAIQGIRFSVAYSTQIRTPTELTTEQCSMARYIASPYMFKHIISIRDSDQDTICNYYPVMNQIFLCNIIADIKPIVILDYITKLINTGFDIRIRDSSSELYNMTATIQVVDNTNVNASVTKKLKTISAIYEEKFQQMKIDLNNAILNIKNTHRNIPDWTTHSNLRMFFIGDDINRYLTIARKSYFKVTDIISSQLGNFKVDSLTRIHGIWIGITIKPNNKICEVTLYNTNLINTFNHIHRNVSSYGYGLNCLCLGTFKSRLYNMTLNSIDDYDRAIDIIQEMLTTINIDDIMGSSRNMQKEFELILKIRNKDTDMNKFKYKTGGWAINDKDKLETDTSGGTWNTFDEQAHEDEERREQQELENEEEEVSNRTILQRLQIPINDTTSTSSR